MRQPHGRANCQRRQQRRQPVLGLFRLPCLPNHTKPLSFSISFDRVSVQSYSFHTLPFRVAIMRALKNRARSSVYMVANECCN